MHNSSNSSNYCINTDRALSNHLKTKSTTKLSSTNHSMCQIATKISSENNGTHKMSPNGYSITLNNDHQHHNDHHLSNQRNKQIEIDSNTKCLVAIYLAALHLRQRMREENLIHPSYSAYLNGENNPRSLFHNCFHSYETIEWLKKQQLCKTSTDGLEIFQVLEKLLIIHHVCDLNQFEYPASGSTSASTIRYLYRFRLDDGTADQNRSFQAFASVYETYTSLFTLDKSQCRGIDLQQEMPLASPYDEQPGITLKGDNLARMIALRSGANMLHVEHIADSMIMYGLVRFDQCDQEDPCDCYCTTKFHNDSHHQYVLSNTHRLSQNKRLDLISLMQPDIFSSLLIHNSPALKRSETSHFVSVSCPDRSPCFSNFQHKLTFNRTLSNYQHHDSSKKPSPSFSSNNCDQCPCSRLSTHFATAFVSPLRISNDGRRNQLQGVNASDVCLVDDERQHSRCISHGDVLECNTQLTCAVNNNDGSRRRKSASLNSPTSIENRPTAEELEKLELPWRWRSFSLKRDRRGYGLILQGQGPCYVERLDPYGSAYTSGIRINEYIYAVEGVNVLRRSGKEVERLLSMFDKCTVYTVYNRDDHLQLATPPNELHTNRVYSIKQSMSFLSPLPNDYNNNSTNNLLTTVASTINDSSCPTASGKLTSCSSSPQQQQNSSPSSSIDGISSCSISPKQSLTTPLNKKRTFSKPFSFFKFNGRSTNSSAPSTDGPK